MKKSTIILTVILCLIIAMCAITVFMTAKFESNREMLLSNKITEATQDIQEMPDNQINKETESINDMEIDLLQINDPQSENTDNTTLIKDCCIVDSYADAFDILAGNCYDASELFVHLNSMPKKEIIKVDDASPYTELTRIDKYGNKYTIVNEQVKATGDVHIRSGPSMNFDKLAILGCNNTITRIGIGENGWSMVLYKGEEAYITSYYLATKGVVEYKEVYETVYANKNANIRTGPTINHTRLGILNKGQAIVRVGVAPNGWSKVLYKGQDAYMYSLYLEDAKDETAEVVSTKEKTEAIPSVKTILEPDGALVAEINYTNVDEMVRAKTNANIRIGPGAECAILGVLEKGDLITRIAIGDNGWSMVLYDGAEAYIYNEYLTAEDTQ